MAVIIGTNRGSLIYGLPDACILRRMGAKRALRGCKGAERTDPAEGATENAEGVWSAGETSPACRGFGEDNFVWEAWKQRYFSILQHAPQTSK